MREVKIAHKPTKKKATGPQLRTERRAGVAFATPRATLLHTQRLVHELQVHQVELELQNEELRATRAELEASVRRYTELFEFAPIGFATVDPQLRLHELNHVAARMLGKARSSLPGTPLKLWLAAGDVPRVEVALAKADETGTQQRVDVALNNGKIVALSVAVLDRGRKLVALQDLPERREHGAAAPSAVVRSFTRPD
jgi:PAS domain-containing protein